MEIQTHKVFSIPPLFAINENNNYHSIKAKKHHKPWLNTLVNTFGFNIIQLNFQSLFRR